MPSKTSTDSQFIARLGKIRKASETEGPAWLLPKKEAAWNAAVSKGFQTRQDDEWRYTDLSPLFSLPVVASRADGGPEGRKSGDKFLAPEDIAVVIANGRLPEELPVIPDEAKGLTLRKFSAVSEEEFRNWLAPDFSQPADLFSGLNTALNYDGLWIHVPAQLQVKPVIHLCHVASEATAVNVFCPRVIVTAEPRAEARILMTFSSASGAAASFTNALTDMTLGFGAKISLAVIQDESHENFYIHSARVTQHKDSSFDSFILTTGSRLSRNNLAVTLLGERADTILKGLSLLQGDRRADHLTAVNHIAANSTSNQLYKGILNGQSRVVFNGKIYVHPDAQQTNAYQLNKNLLMGDHCRVNTKPQLEIFADDVKCSHGATVGQMDPNEVFYLQSRGVPQKTAVAMLAKGFVDEMFPQSRDSILERFLLTVNPLLGAVDH